MRRTAFCYFLTVFGIKCTSAVPCNVQCQVYEHARPLSISLITISLRCVGFLFCRWLAVRTIATVRRPYLMKYHMHLLPPVGDGTGRWTFTPISSSPLGTAADADTPTPQPDAFTAPTTPGGWPAAVDLIRVLEGIRMFEKRLEEVQVHLGNNGEWNTLDHSNGRNLELRLERIYTITVYCILYS